MPYMVAAVFPPSDIMLFAQMGEPDLILIPLMVAPELDASTDKLCTKFRDTVLPAAGALRYTPVT